MILILSAGEKIKYLQVSRAFIVAWLTSLRNYIQQTFREIF